MPKPNTELTRRQFWKFILQRMGGTMTHDTVSGVINILLEEMFQDMKHGIDIPIGNFGKFAMKQLAGREHHDVKTNTLRFSPGKRTVRFYLTDKLHQFLLRRLDFDKTFGRT